MIKISEQVEKKQKNFWNHCVFHPTDAIEDPWGKRILDQMSKDGAIKTVRMYTMFEDIVYMNENDELQFDFRLSDCRLDYMLEKGFDLLLSYAGIPDCIASSLAHKTSVAKNKTRYKGKMWNTSAPKNYELWEEICYQYTKHNVERYGLEVVSKWHCQCFNEADIGLFFMSDLPDNEEGNRIRVQEYCRLYEAFEKGIRKASEAISIGGPALALKNAFLGDFLDFVKEKKLKLDFISLHHYGTEPALLNNGSRPYNVVNNLEKHKSRMDVIQAHGFADTTVIIDEWGMAAAGFYNKEECPALLARETEVFSAYFVKLIHAYIYSKYEIEKMLICLSGQHEMVEDFSGFRNFFTLHFIKKPIYNAYVLASKLGENILGYEKDNADIFVIPTKTETGVYAILLTYATDTFTQNLPDLEENIRFEKDIQGKTVTIWAIDKEHTNPYRLYQKMGWDRLTSEQIAILREEGNLKPLSIAKDLQSVDLRLTAGATFLITVE